MWILASLAIVNVGDNAPIDTMIKGLLIFTMGGIGPNLQLQSDGSEIVCAIRAPHKTYAYQIWGKISVPDIKNLGLPISP